MPRRVRLVLVHGSQLSHAMWARYPALLGPDVDLVTPDLPAHGTRRDEPFTWEGALAVIDEAVDGGDPDVPVVLAGHSLGGYLAMAWASGRPDRLAGLALLGASAVPAGPGALLYRAIARVEHRLGADRMSRALDREFDALLPPAFAALLKEAGYGFEGIPAAWDGVMGRCRPEMLAEVTAPGPPRQRAARPAAGRRAPLPARGPRGTVDARRHRAAGAARPPADPPRRDGGRPLGARPLGPPRRAGQRASSALTRRAPAVFRYEDSTSSSTSDQSVRAVEVEPHPAGGPEVGRDEAPRVGDEGLALAGVGQDDDGAARAAPTRRRPSPSRRSRRRPSSCRTPGGRG